MCVYWCISLSNVFARGVLVAGIAVTPLHPGTGRAPGVVDLPVARDSLGYPIVFASALKGALKALCGRRLCRKDGAICVDDSGRLRCDDCGDYCMLCCCLFGSEPGESETQPAVLSVVDFVPFAFPTPSVDLGYVYVTSRLLLHRVYLILESLDYARSSKAGELKQVVGELIVKSSDDESIILGKPRHDTIDVAGLRERVRAVELSDTLKSKLAEILGKIGGLASTLSERLVVLPDDKAPSVIEKSLIKITRVRLRRDRKTVVEGALWTEEYIPPGTVFIGGIIALPTENEYCRKYCSESSVSEKVLERLLDEFKSRVLKAENDVVYFVVGGKETIGKGLIKAILC